MKVKLVGFKEVSLKHTLFHALKPNEVFYPIEDGVTLLVHPGDYVYKGMVIGRYMSFDKLPICSSISGTFLEIRDCQYVNGVKRSVVIQNDFKEKMMEYSGTRSDIHSFTCDQFISIIKDAGIVGMGGDGFPTYLKYDVNKNIQTLLINAVECEPCISSDSMIIKEKCESILECLDAIMHIFHISECVIAVCKTNTDVIRVLETYLGTYVNIRMELVPNLYPIGWEKMLIEETIGVTCENDPIEKGIVVQNVSTVYAIYQALKYGTPLMERIVTFTGDMFLKPRNVIVKVGSNVRDVIHQFGRYKRNKDVYFVAGGAMMGKCLPSDDLIIEPHMNCILVLKANTDIVEEDCIRCGRCIDVCPVHISPVLIGEHLDHDLTSYHPEKCIECGLCSYICPARISVRSKVVEAKKKLLERKSL